MQASRGPVESVERALDSPLGQDGDVGVNRGRFEPQVPEQLLDEANVRAILEQMGGEAVPQRVTCRVLLDPGYGDGPRGGALRGADRDVAVHFICGKEEVEGRPRFRLPPKEALEAGGQHDLAILSALAAVD